MAKCSILNNGLYKLVMKKPRLVSFTSTEYNVRRSIFSCLENVGSLEQFICLTKIYVDIINDLPIKIEA